MRKYLFRILFAFVLIIVISSLVYSFSEKGLRMYSATNFTKFNEMFCDTTYYDILLLGSSRTHRNIDPQILDSIWGLKVYNGGISGAGGYEMITALKGFLNNRRPPKVVLLNVDLGIMNIDRVFFNTSFYFESFKNPYIYDAFAEKGFPVFLYKNIPFCRMVEYNDDMRNSSLQGLMGKKDIYEGGFRGFLPMKEDIGMFDTVYSQRNNLNYTMSNLQYVDSVLSISKRYNITPLFIVAPVYNHHYRRKHQNYDSFISLINKKYYKYTSDNMIFFDDLPINYSCEYFDDNIHLNSKGGKLFSAMLAKRIAELNSLK